ncbi:MAG: hypothetical protein JJ975_04925 [Bacteroidia bacterium]|nr:hypothetical protein [Bacteroidia bacterium]
MRWFKRSKAVIVTDYLIQLYKRVGGDVDHLQRIGSRKEKRAEVQTAIVEMEELAAELQLVRSGKVSEEYAKRIEKKLRDMCPDEQIAEEMRQLSPFWTRSGES